jgi:hypothetical protein
MSNAPYEVAFFDLLPDGTYLEQALCREFRREVESAIRWLPPGVNCDIRDLVTPQFWLPLDRWTRVKLGRFLAHWVGRGELPLEFASPAKRSNKKYRLRH